MTQHNPTYASLWRRRKNLPPEARRALNRFVREVVALIALSVTAGLVTAFLVYYGLIGVTRYVDSQVPLVGERPLGAYIAVGYILFLLVSTAGFLIGSLITAIAGAWEAHSAGTSLLRGAFVDGLLGPPAPWSALAGRIFGVAILVGSAVGLVHHLHVIWGWNLAVSGIVAALCAMSLPAALVGIKRLTLTAPHSRVITETE